MIEEPYRWVEAIGNRREYIEHQLAGGSPIAALTYRDGLLFVTLGRERQKIFEIYDRIAMGAIGHPGDIERLRMAAIEVASTEGFTRSARDVSLRRMATYSLSPALKAAFEQVYGPPYLTRMLFAELGREPGGDLFVSLDYDGAIHTNGNVLARAFEQFGVIAGTAASCTAMQEYLRAQDFASADLQSALKVGLRAWAVGHITALESPDQRPEEHSELLNPEAIALHLAEQLSSHSIDAAILERGVGGPVTYRTLGANEMEQVAV